MYFAALLARTEDGWEASDTELDDVETLDDLADLAREASDDDDTVLAYIEQEDSWFGVVRVDGEEDPRIYVSDATAASRSSYGEILLTDELLGRDPDEDLDMLVDLDGTEEGEPEPAAVPEEDESVPPGPIGEAGILSDLGVSEAQLLTLRSDALSVIAEALGCGDVLEGAR
ncbi:tRNA adenosine deaminase-associated protein [Streptomyces meridianus]|uniref:tRNA adenosine deaminase-associated protein n=1 Tax=Streptomyces meridianus TaxID=2938945 RepID=A0ABT0XCL2_9ACTN|nr:tRNA adenosine deaminase-associated protein [Streptomyces meridianus]MCM2580169.1 tRNA adenosine deaminase-associated protein [Streptomyces meridianus]